jgi:WXG100 family type VII secretion target
MSTPIHVTPEHLHYAAASFRKATADMSDLLAQLDRTANHVTSSWNGRSRASFDQLWTEWYRAMRNLEAVLDTMADTMDAGATNMTTVDDTSMPHASP